jgi:hypothetical protein
MYGGHCCQSALCKCWFRFLGAVWIVVRNNYTSRLKFSSCILWHLQRNESHPGRRAGNTVFPVQSRYSSTVYGTIYTNFGIVLQWMENTNFWEELRIFLILSLEYFFLHWEAVQIAFFSKRFSPYMGRLTTKPLRLSSCSPSSPWLSFNIRLSVRLASFRTCCSDVFFSCYISRCWLCLIWFRLELPCLKSSLEEAVAT